MTQTLADMLDDTTSPAERWLVWAKIAADFPVSLAKSQMQYVGGVMHNETPGYIKRTGILTGVLIIPFFLALLANSLDKVMYNHTLYNSWLWRGPVLAIWVLWLPAMALALALLSYCLYAFKPVAHTEHLSWFRRAFDISHAWPVVLPGIIGLGILCILAFHDSVHCWMQNPMHYVTQHHQVWECTTHGFLGG
jgi:hypothetical protein